MGDLPAGYSMDYSIRDAAGRTAIDSYLAAQLATCGIIAEHNL